uniref:Uncharacterized protein n=1 Tax=Anguilla anguilla TaxID=7936 RepID=A0A0E9R6H6_ANGAN
MKTCFPDHLREFLIISTCGRMWTSHCTSMLPEHNLLSLISHPLRFHKDKTLI